MPDKIRVLALADYCCSTGFATVSSNIMQQLSATDRYDLDIIGINFTGDPYDRKRFPGNVFPAMTIDNFQMQDPYGRQKFFDVLMGGEYDVVFILQDTFIVQTMVTTLQQAYDHLDKKFKVIFYFPFDCTPKRDWVSEVVSKVDFPVAYTNYGKQLAVDVDPTLENKLDVIYHGTNLTDFKYMEDREDVANFRKQYFNGKADGKFLISNINRNQPRKDIIRNFLILQELRNRGVDDVVLYLHMKHDDVGGNLLVMADNFGFQLGEDFILPANFQENRGMPVEMVNMLYNASDAVITTTYGEGWGLSITEAMATKTPIIAPDNTSLHEMLADNRGLLVPSGEHPGAFTMVKDDFERLRPQMNVSVAADKIIALKEGREVPDIDGAYQWAHKYSWEAICKEWVKLFDKAALEARTAKPDRAERRRKEKEMAKIKKKAENARLSV